KTEEQLKLQFTLEETRLQFQETKELLMREQEKAKEIEDMEHAKTEENVRLRAALEEMRLQFQETKELLMKECEKGKDSTAGAFVVQEAHVIDLEMVNKLVTENEILKASKEAKNKESARLQPALEEMNLQLQETRALLTIEHETANRTTKNKCLVQDLYVINQEKVNEFTAAERPVAPEKVNERIADHVYTAHETQKISMEQVPAAQDIKFIDHEIVNKLTAENMQLKKQRRNTRKQPNLVRSG
ncbi:unnamed protein product, partial [Cuscuta campestris]